VTQWYFGCYAEQYKQCSQYERRIQMTVQELEDKVWAQDRIRVVVRAAASSLSILYLWVLFAQQPAKGYGFLLSQE
jgi:hypothetical protein